MTNVITQKEIQKYSEQMKVVFPRKTIITPAARDWAVENGVELAIEDTDRGKSGIRSFQRKTKQEFLANTIGAAAREIKNSGRSMDKEQLIDIVAKSLKKMNCNINL